MHQAGAVLGGDVVGEHDEVRRRAALLDGRELDQLERPLVGPALHLRAGDRALDGPALAEHRLDQRLGDDERLGAVGGQHVGDVGAHGDGGVGHQGPRRRRPDQQRRAPVAQGPEVSGNRT